MRAYAALDAAALTRLQSGHSVQPTWVLPASEDEEDEYDALLEAAEDGPVVVAAELAAVDDPLTLAVVASFHLDADGSGDLAWYAVQELGHVIDLLG